MLPETTVCEDVYEQKEGENVLITKCKRCCYDSQFCNINPLIPQVRNVEYKQQQADLESSTSVVKTSLLVLVGVLFRMLVLE